jgi:DNA-binding response OmpR family regulator
MPGPSAAELYEEIGRDWPGLRRGVAFVTGATTDDPEVRELAAKGCELLPKPYEVVELQALVARLVAATSPAYGPKEDTNELVP